MPLTNQDSFEVYSNIYFIGIGGIGISALARILKAEGHQVSGSDLSKNLNTELLEKEGIKVNYDQKAENLPSKLELAIYTKAIPSSNLEFAEAQRRGIKILSYPEAVGLLSKRYKTICLSGTHGKTTTTALLGLSLEANDQDPTVIVGSLIKEFGNKNERLGKSDFLVLESCEYQDSFLNYHPEILVINNVDPEHLDYFGNEENYLNSFKKFIGNLKSGGHLIVNGDDSNIRKIITNLKDIQITTFGESLDNDYQIQGHKILKKGSLYCQLNLSIPGQHNVRNATVSVIISDILNLDLEKTIKSLNTFKGANRRFEIKGQIGKTTIIDDYGHTPAEIQATLEGTREKFGTSAKILCIFQPHQYSRTHLFLNDFAQSFKLANKVYIPNIYRSRDTEEDLQKVNPQILVDAINKFQPGTAEYTKNFEETISRTEASISSYDIVMTIGAGDITKLSDDLLKLN